MGMPQDNVSLSPEEVDRLSRMLADTRHSINNRLTLLSTALELIRRKPDSIERMMENMTEQPPKIRDELADFTSEFERTLKVIRE